MKMNESEIIVTLNKNHTLTVSDNGIGIKQKVDKYINQHLLV